MSKIVAIQELSQDYYEAVKESALSLVSSSSATTYSRAYARWEEWCFEEGVNMMDLRPATVKRYLVSRDVTKSTRQNELTALRNLLKMAKIDHTQPQFRGMYEALLEMKATDENEGGEKREKHILSPQQVWKILGIWNENDVLSLRNKALLSVMFYTGMRRFEIATMQWKHIDFDNGTINIPSGKGDKERDVPIIEDREKTCETALLRWRAAQGEMNYVFTPIRKGRNLAKDKPISARQINNITESTAIAAGIDFKPHDGRRTLATDLHQNGADVFQIQDVLGHSNVNTTREYVKRSSARKLRENLKTSY